MFAFSHPTGEVRLPDAPNSAASVELPLVKSLRLTSSLKLGYSAATIEHVERPCRRA